MTHNYLLALCISLLSMGTGFAQNRIMYEVRDAQTYTDILVGATVVSTDGQQVVSDEWGRFTLEVVDSTVTFTVSYLGYEPQTITYEVPSQRMPPPASIRIPTVYLVPGTSVLTQVVITGSQRERLVIDEGMTVEVIRTQFLEKNNITSLADAVERVPGVQMIDEQVNIRSSGYSYGAGSRVSVIVDGQPLLGGLSGDVKWNFVPFENAARIEVMKGASSVLYGSAAMNGVINVITATPTEKPYTSVTLYGGEYSAPQSPYRQWWTRDNRPMTRGAVFAHRVRNGKLDLVLGGNYHSRIEHLQDLEEERKRFNWKTNYRLTDKLSFGVDGNIMEHYYGGFLVWQDADTNALKHIGNFALNTYITSTIDPHLTYQDPAGNIHTAKGRIFNVTFQRRRGLPDAPARVTSGEYTFKRDLNKNMRLTAGLSQQRIYAEDPVEFIDTTGGIASFTANISAVYAQMDMDFLNDRLNVVAGLRAERLSVADTAYNRTIPISRLSAVYKPDNRNRFRANLGQGYRLPSMIERFVATPIFETGIDLLPTVNVVPNPSILPEIGLSYEIGYKRLFDHPWMKGYWDVALFSMDYWNLTEVVFGYHGRANVPINEFETDKLGFQMQNSARARIAGIEISTYTSGKIATIPYRLWAGYTYAYPGDLDSLRANDLNYYSLLAQGLFSGVDSTMASTVLRYRSMHTARIDLEFPLKDWLTIGGAANYNGYMWTIDEVFVGEGYYGQTLEFLLGEPLIPGFKEYREQTQGGDWVFDARASVSLGKHVRISGIINNVLNREYSLRPGRMNAPRSYNLRCQFTF